MYKSFLICEHPMMINFYSEGIEIATYHKTTKEFQLKTKSIEKFRDAKSSFHAAALLLSLNEFKFEQPIEHEAIKKNDFN